MSTERPPPVEIRAIDGGSEKGQIVAPTTEFIRNTEQRKKDILQRLQNMPVWAPTPPNFNKLRQLLNLSAEEFLGSFPSPSYASDVLNELASLTVCPDVKLLAARDHIHMHAIELQLHLARVIAQVRLLSNHEIKISTSLTTDHLGELEKLGKLREKLVEYSVSRDPKKIFDELLPLTDKPQICAEWLKKNTEPVLDRVIKENQLFSDTLGEISTFDDAKSICNLLVLYGLIATYAAWYSCALRQPDEMGSFRTSILFCTRILLDAKRWEICRVFAHIALGSMLDLNKRDKKENQQKGTGMLTANLFYSRLMCGEQLMDLEPEIRRWNVEELHLRYHFLKAVLLEEFDSAGLFALELLAPSTDTGVPNMCLQEFKEWPILEKFRASVTGKKLLTREQ